jgi:hypothetical protein
MDSTTVMIERLGGMLGTDDLKQHEADFVLRLQAIVKAGRVTMLTEKQLDWLTDLHRRHFG